MKIVVTGIAGFVGYHLAKNLSDEGYEVIGIDNINSYYDINLKDKLRDLGINDFESSLESTKYNISFFNLDINNQLS